MIRFIEKGKAPIKETPHDAEVRALQNTEHVQMSHIEIAPGKALRKHITPVDAIFYILEGEATVLIGDEEIVVGKDTFVDSPAKIPHQVLNNGESTLRFLVIKAPRPTEQTKML